MSGFWLGGELGPGARLVFTQPDGVRLVVLLFAVLALGWAVRSARRAPPAGLELTLFALGLGWVSFAALGPELVSQQRHREAPRLAVLIDDSRSMAVIEGGTPRQEAVQPWLDALAGPGVELFRFGGELHPGGEATWDAPNTDLAGALQALADRYAGERLAGVVLLSDGLDRGGLRRAYQEDGKLALPELPGPLTVVQIGDARELQDLSITQLDSGGFGFIHSPFGLTARLEAPAWPGRAVPVTLTRDGQLVAERTVTLGEDGRAEVSFEVTARQAGRFIYEVNVPVWAGDAVPGNNRMAAAVRVVRDRLRVLQVCGSPSFDQKFLRLFLKQDPAVDLVSFFILRTLEDSLAAYDDRELSLIKFPYEQLFAEDLDSFDLIIFQNFDYKPFFNYEPEVLLGNVAEFVKKGKAFVMIGGDRSFDLGEYADTPIADVLPVQLGLPGKPTDEAAFQPSLTPQGRVHPVTRLLGDATENEALWGRLSALDGLNLSVGPAPGSAVLLSHPTLKTAQGRAMPVLAVREVGRGRTMALMGDSSWRWVMAEAARGQGNQAYLRFWKNAMRWLVRDPEGERVQVSPARESALLGEPLALTVAVRDVGFSGQEGVAVAVKVSGPSGEQVLEATTDAQGLAVVEYTPTAPGPYRVRAQAGSKEAEASSAFAVTARDPELEEITPDAAFLQALATATQGRYYGPGEEGPALRDPEAGRMVDDERRARLWAAPAGHALAGALLGAAWWVRRRRGLR